jgi:nucleotide-binding universal stress UspA family protein
MDLLLEPPGPIVVGVERSECSRDALALARVLAREVGTRLIAVAAYPIDARSATMDRHAYARALEDEAEAALEWVARPHTGFPPERRAVAATSVTLGLQQVATAEDALAIVVGPSRRAPLGQIVPGNVGLRLLHGAPCAVAVAPRGYRANAPAGIREIGVGYVAGLGADEAVSAAVGLAARTGAAVRVRSVVEPLAVTAEMPLARGYGELEETARLSLTQRMRRAIDDVATPVGVSGEVVDGYADDELAQFSREIDLLVCGSPGDGPVGSVMLGSVSTGVLRKGHCPLLVVPRGVRGGFGFAALRASAAAIAS